MATDMVSLKGLYFSRVGVMIFLFLLGSHREGGGVAV